MLALRVESLKEKPQWREIPIPSPSKNEVLVRIEACGLNFADLLLMKGNYQEKPALPFTLGMELAGRVTQVGHAVTSLKEGQKVAENIAYRHNLSEYFLCNTLGIPWYEVHQHAHRLEHAMTPVVVEKLAEYLDNPEFCPNGTPNPGTTLPKNTISLMDSKPGMTVEVAMISELLEDSVDLMKILHEHRIMPGNQHKVVEKTEVMRSISLESEEGPSTLPFHVAENIFVVQVPAD